jgi:deoxyribodipyrimidine photo-lyase
MWFRRDLRVADHPALTAAAAHGSVVPLFVVDPRFDNAGAPRRAYLAGALRSLADSIDGGVVVRRGDPAQVVPSLAAEIGAAQVFVTRDYGPAGRRRDAAVSEALMVVGARLVGVSTPYVAAPGDITKADGTAYRVFTPFRRAWADVPLATPMPTPQVTWRHVASDPIPSPPRGEDLPTRWDEWWREIGETPAQARWERFLASGVDDYDEQRNLPAADGTSKMSADLRWGIMHPRQLLADLAPNGERRSHDVFASELAWRDFYADVLFGAPETSSRNVNRRMDVMLVDTDEAARTRFAAWQQGLTGYPIVDAGMRQLLATGWMHNRVRMIVASFLTKDLHLPWQWGARHFMRHLVDGDLASNSHGWQWTAGTGTDAAPFFRVFNPTSQGEKFDPDGMYIRRYVPELRDLDDRSVHAPGPLQRGDYPAPMVDHAAERAESLRRYKMVSEARH